MSQNKIKTFISDEDNKMPRIGVGTRLYKGWGQSVKLGPHSAIWGKLGTALQAYALNPCTKFPPNPTSRKVNT